MGTRIINTGVVMKNTSILTLIIVSACFIILSGCYYDKEELVYPTGLGSCDTTAVTYTNTVVPILNTNCYTCHKAPAAAGGIVLDNHAALLIQVNNTKLLGDIEHRLGYNPMPKGGAKMQECDIAKIRTWIRAGAPNN